MIFTDSIVALSSGHLPSGVAVIRISGPQSRFACETISGPVPPNRRVALRALTGLGGQLLDHGLVIFFPGPASFTGEDLAEFQVHGGRAVVAAVLAALTGLPGVRHAEAGEFTRRAFLNGKLSLPETEGLADLVNAETEAQRRFALQNAQGAQSALYTGWRRRLIHARAMIEAEIDFSDEEDVPGSVSDLIWADVAAMVREIDEHISGYRTAEVIREGFDVVIVGAPNAGKSTLFNALVQREAAIVTDEPGTTRDLLEVNMDLAGVRVRITDTAGLRSNPGKVEGIGIERAKGRAKEADLVIILEDMSNPIAVGDIGGAAAKLRIGSKLDLVKGSTVGLKQYDLAISAKDEVGVDRLIEMIGTRALTRTQAVSGVLPSRLRHVELLETTNAHLKAALRESASTELKAEDLRTAAEQLGRIVGSVDVEDLLDVIFSQFCIGK